MDLHFEVGGSLLSLADVVNIESSKFMGNMGYLGGAIFINCKLEKPDVVMMASNLYFFNNTGFDSFFFFFYKKPKIFLFIIFHKFRGIIGGGVGFYLDFKTLDATIQNSTFLANHAYCIS